MAKGKKEFNFFCSLRSFEVSTLLFVLHHHRHHHHYHYYCMLIMFAFILYFAIFPFFFFHSTILSNYFFLETANAIEYDEHREKRVRVCVGKRKRVMA